jgi:hypothetical protein
MITTSCPCRRSKKPTYVLLSSFFFFFFVSFRLGIGIGLGSGLDFAPPVFAQQLQQLRQPVASGSGSRGTSAEGSPVALEEERDPAVGDVEKAMSELEAASSDAGGERSRSFESEEDEDGDDEAESEAEGSMGDELDPETPTTATSTAFSDTPSASTSGSAPPAVVSSSSSTAPSHQTSSSSRFGIPLSHSHQMAFSKLLQQTSNLRDDETTDAAHRHHI